MNAPVVLQGVISRIESPYAEKYGNVSVVMVVDGAEDKPILAYRLAGEGADKLAEGDTVTVAGIIKNYKGTVEFDQGCKIVPNESFKDAKTAVASSRP